jgi:hypothetical protein
MGTDKDPKQVDEGVKFLERDFNQCFEQMRHYDSQIIDLGKFAFTAYPVVVGAAVGIYKYGLEKSHDYSNDAGMIPFIAFFPGFFLLWHMVRTRVYFVRVTRYINEHRKVFLALNPLNFRNDAGMYNNPEEPHCFDRYSSQLYFMCILAILNSFLGGVAVYLFTVPRTSQWTWVGIGFVGLLIIQIAWMIHHLLSEGKSPAGYRDPTT